MKSVKGHKLIELSGEEFAVLSKSFTKLIVDLGCGDGQFVYKNALKNPENLYIGVDPAIQQAEEFVRKTARKRLKNLLFVVGSYEILPIELLGLVDELYIILPWGSLLGAVAQPTAESVTKLSSLLKSDGQVNIIFGYDPDLEPSQTARLELQNLDENYIKNTIISAFLANSFKESELKKLSRMELKNMDSTWGQKISLKADRPIYKITLKKV